MLKKEEIAVNKTYKMDSRIAIIGGVKVNSSSLEQVLREICSRIARKQKTIVFTPNPEFIVYAKKHQEFKKLLNFAHFSIPDGIGLVLASRILANKVSQPIEERISGSDFTTALLDLANQNRWSIGIAGVRRGVKIEAEQLISRLKSRYPEASFVNLDDNELKIKNLKLKIVFACHGMAKQEQWISQNFDKLPGLVFVGIGGSLDFLTGFSRRAPFWIRKIGLEWLWRGIQKPAHFRRIWIAVVKFPWLVLQEEFKNYQP